MKTKTKRIYIRVSESEHREIISNSKNFQGITHYILSAIKEFSNMSHREKIDGSKEILKLYWECNVHLAHIGGNLNQTVHKINELTKEGVDVSSIIITEIYPQLGQVYSFCMNLQRELLRITDTYRV